MTPSRIVTDRPQTTFWLLSAFLVIVMMTGGASRVDVQSLAILRPLSIVFCTIASLGIRREEIVGQHVIFIGFALLFVMIGLQLVPLPTWMWSVLPGREPATDVARATGIGAVWRPITLTPMNGWHTLLSLFAPLAVLLLGVQLRKRDLRRLLLLLIVFGAISGLFGLIQIIGRPNGPFYLYRVTNITSAVGLFANRNHAALLLAMMFPMLATWATLNSGSKKHEDAGRARIATALALSLFLFPLVIVTGSRSGLLLSLIGIASAAVIYVRSKMLPTVADARRLEPWMRWLALGGMLIGVAALAALSFYLAKGEAIQRLLGGSLNDDGRNEGWRTSIWMLWHYFPVGSGAGSFADAYQIFEPTRDVDLYYLNHVHNDFIEFGLTFGIIGMALLAAAIVVYSRRVIALWRDRSSNSNAAKLSRSAAIAILMIAVASFVDYPLRTPSLMCVFALLTLWLFEAGHETSSDRLPGDRETGR